MREYRRTYRIFVYGGKVRVHIYDDEGFMYGATIVDEPVDEREAIIFALWTWKQVLDGWMFT